jgi:succinyl-CoA synthetase beta subunit
VEYSEVCKRIDKTTRTEGWQDIEKFLNDRMEALVSKIASGESGVDIENVTVNSHGKITIVSVNRDTDQHELRFWKLFKAQIK